MQAAFAGTLYIASQSVIGADSIGMPLSNYTLARLVTKWEFGRGHFAAIWIHMLPRDLRC